MRSFNPLSQAGASATGENTAAPTGSGAGALHSRTLLQRSTSDGAARRRSSLASWQPSPPSRINGLGFDPGSATGENMAAPTGSGAGALHSRTLLQRSTSDGAARRRSSLASWQPSPPSRINGLGFDPGIAADADLRRQVPSRDLGVVGGGDPRRRLGRQGGDVPSTPRIAPGDALTSLARVRSFHKPADSTLDARDGGRVSLARLRSFRQPAPPTTSADGRGCAAAPRQERTENYRPLALAGNRLSQPAALMPTSSNGSSLRGRSHLSSRLRRARSGGGFVRARPGPDSTKLLSRSSSDSGTANRALVPAYDQRIVPGQVGARARHAPRPPAMRTLMSSKSE